MGVSLPRTFMHTFLSGTDFAGAPPGNRTRECGGGGAKSLPPSWTSTLSKSLMKCKLLLLFQS